MIEKTLNNIKQMMRPGEETEKQAPPLPRAPVFDDTIEVDESFFPENPPTETLLPLAFLKRFKFLILDDSDDGLVVVMTDPLDFNTREVIRETYQKKPTVYKASPEIVSQFMYRWYEAEADMAEEKEGAEEADLSLEDQLWDNLEQLKDIASEAPVIRLVNHLITKAFELGASDIHIEPRRQTVQVRYRIDGVLHDQEVIALKLKAAITSRVKLMAKMDIAERRLPQDGRIKFKMGREEIDIRVSSIPIQYGESLVLRLLVKENVQLDLRKIGFPERILDQFKSVISLPYGMLLVTGPTGSGKTTTLYAALSTINHPDKKIITIEDPVEYQLDGINQVQVQSNIGLTFANTLRSFLRHDPDVMLVGEIRDKETAEISIHAALTGHLVFSTLHTNDAAGAITRLEDMGVEPFMVASTLAGVLAQRLIRQVCPNCHETIALSLEECQKLAHDLDVDESLVTRSFSRGKGCKICGETGYKGRIGIFEFLHADDEIQREIVKGADRNKIFKKAIEKGMYSLRMDGLEKVRLGISTYEEVMRITR